MATEELILNYIGNDFQETFEEDEDGADDNNSSVIMNFVDVKTPVYDIKYEDMEIKHESHLIEISEKDIKVESKSDPETSIEEKSITTSGGTTMDSMDWDDWGKLEIKVEELLVNQSETPDSISTTIDKINFISNIDCVKLERLHYGNIEKSEENASTVTSNVKQLTTNAKIDGNLPRNKQQLIKSGICIEDESGNVNEHEKYRSRGKHKIIEDADSHQTNQIRRNKETFQCEHCDYSSNIKKNYDRHVVIHGTSKPFVCTICDKNFHLKRYFDSHIIHSHSDNANLMGTITHKINECQQCSFKCIYSTQFKSHMLKHNELIKKWKKLACEHCDYTSYRRNDLIKHLSIHSNSKPLVCTICDKHFRQKRYLDSHIVYCHSDNNELMATITRKIYECQQCSFKCIYSTQFKTHMLNHKELIKDWKKLACEHCSYTTYVRSILNKHLLIHKKS